jgi:hypothetical protein
MLQRALLFLSAAAAFALSPYATRLGPVAGPALLVALGVGLALAASGSLNAIAAATGAVGAFAAGVLATTVPAVAGAVLCALCYTERTMRVRGAVGRAVHVGVALAGGALAGGAAAHFAGAAMTVQAVVVVVAAVLCSLPQLVDAEDPLAHSLDELAEELPDAIAARLREGAELCRSVEPTLLDRESHRLARQTWTTLLQLATTRVRLERTQKQRPGAAHGAAVRQRLDRRIEEHVDALARMYTAVDEVKAAEASLEDGALRTVENNNESLEQMSKAIVEEVQA